MTEEPYRWLDAIANRREYVEGQLKGGTPVFAMSLEEGILLFGVGTGQSKVFEIFDRHALAALGHPADLERVRQALIDSAHLEAFARASADVSLRRLVSFVLSPQLKTAFEQIFSPPFLLRLLLAEVGESPARDVLVAMDFDGTFRLRGGGSIVAAEDLAAGKAAEEWLGSRVDYQTPVARAAGLALEAWRHLVAGQPLPTEHTESASSPPGPGADRVIEAALLVRKSSLAMRYRPLDPRQLGLLEPTPP